MINEISKSKRIVVKIGSSLIVKTDPKSSGIYNNQWLKTLASDIKYIRSLGFEVVIVTSGAIASTKAIIKTDQNQTIEIKQALSSIGQVQLMSMYNELFEGFDIKIAQILMDKYDSENIGRRLNIKSTVNNILSLNALPIINENDALSADEIKIGDNDTLSAIVASIIEADLLVLLSDVDGFYTSNPNIDKNATLIQTIRQIDESTYKMAGGSISGLGTGGMFTKIKAAEIATQNGVEMIITSGINNNPLTKNLFFTKFTTDTTTLKSRKQIIEGVTNTNASVKVSSFGANGQIEVSSVLSIDGFFKRGEAIKAFDKSGSYTLGISELDSTELQTILTNPNQPQRTTKLIHHFNSIKPVK